jgi:diadenosine tetraphosphate (Ap4A) HIT family hydrolase
VTEPDYATAMLAAVRAAEIDGLLPAPASAALGDIFPFQHSVTFVPFDEPVLPEPARNGEDPAECHTCARPDSDFDWTDEHWLFSDLTGPGKFGVFAFMLHPRAHSDLADLAPELAAELGPMLIRVERAITAGIDGVGRVHINRWGDGGAHLHWWFIVRPAGLLQLRGSRLPTWLDVLPPLPTDVVTAAVSRVVEQL